MQVKNIPYDINAEELLLYFEDTPKRMVFCGSHKRDAYMDIARVDYSDGLIGLHLARNSLYDVLPEYMFHPIDRFDNIPETERKERFKEEIDAQEEEIRAARRFFAPIDIMLLRLRCDVRKAMQKYAESDVVLERVLTDTLPERLRGNRFVRHTLPFMPACKYIRGDKTLITLMLRKVLAEENISLDVYTGSITTHDEKPRYAYCLGGEVAETYVADEFDEAAVCYDLHYWSDEDCDEHFMTFIDDIEQYRSFIADYFLSVEDTLRFFLVKDSPPLRLTDTFVYNYLGYNTNI